MPAEEDPNALHPISVNMNLPGSLIREIERAAKLASLAPADWVVLVLAERLGFTIEWMDGPNARKMN